MRALPLILFLGGFVFVNPALRGSSSGLNNIPTADTAGNLQLVFQGYSTFGSGFGSNDWVAFKFGIDPWTDDKWKNRFEFGVDSYYAPNAPGPGVLQFKYTTQPDPNLPAICFGIANLAVTPDQRAAAGQPFSYLVLTQNLGFMRLTGGYGLQESHGNSALLGADKTVRLAGHEVMLRADAIQTDHEHNWAASFGGITSVGKYFAVEAWVTQPVHGHPASFTLKLDVILHI